MKRFVKLKIQQKIYLLSILREFVCLFKSNEHGDTFQKHLQPPSTLTDGRNAVSDDACCKLSYCSPDLVSYPGMPIT